MPEALKNRAETSDSPDVTPRDDEFVAWLGSPVVHVAMTHDHGQWYALALDFDIVGVGQTEAEAYRRLSGMLQEYLYSFYADGASVEHARRPVPGLAMPKTAGVGAVGEVVRQLRGLWDRRHRREFILPAALQ